MKNNHRIRSRLWNQRNIPFRRRNGW